MSDEFCAAILASKTRTQYQDLVELAEIGIAGALYDYIRRSR